MSISQLEIDYEDQEIEDPLGDEDPIQYEYSITSYGADYPVDGLVKRVRNNDVYVPPFQRDYVWSINDASRFIESLLLGLPVPGIFLSKEPKDQQLLVIDGQQRLKSLVYFYEGTFKPTGKPFRLKGVQPEYEGKTYTSLPNRERRRLDDSIIHATVVKQDKPSKDNSSIYHIFERINSGGRNLRPQEIRACIYQGRLNELLRSLNENEEWRSIFGRVNKRMRDQELILRFLALFYFADAYSSPMKGFLNKYMAANKDLELQGEEEIRGAFESTISVLHASLGDSAFKPKQYLNAAVFDAVMVGVARRLDHSPIHDHEDVRRRYELLLDNEDFQNAYQKSTAQESSVANRLRLSTEAFAGVQ